MSSTYANAIKMTAQSILCHPDWDLDTHLAYLESEGGFDLDEDVTTAKWPYGPRTHLLRDYVRNWIKWPERCVEVARRHK